MIDSERKREREACVERSERDADACTRYVMIFLLVGTCCKFSAAAPGQLHCLRRVETWGKERQIYKVNLPILFCCFTVSLFYCLHGWMLYPRLHVGAYLHVYFTLYMHDYRLCVCVHMHACVSHILIGARVCRCGRAMPRWLRFSPGPAAPYPGSYNLAQ